MCHFCKTNLNLRQFYTNPKFILSLWKYLAEMNEKHVGLLKKTSLGGVTGKEIYAPSRPNIPLPDAMVRCTYI